MSGRTGLGVVETAVLLAVADLGGAPTAGYRKTDRVLARLEDGHGLGARYAYPLMRDLRAPWRLHLPLLDGNGNWGWQGDGFAADSRYTEVRLSPVGALAVAAERGEVGPVPLGLLEGSLYREGPVPPFDPRRVVAALKAGSDDAGRPALPTGGTLEGDLAALLAGRRARLRHGCVIVEEQGALVVTNLPLGVSGDQVHRNLQMRAFELHGGPGRRDDGSSRAFGIRDVVDDSTERIGIRIVCRLTVGSDVAAARDWMESVWPLTMEVDCRLPAPMATRLSTWDGGDGSGLRALADLLG